MILNCYLLLTQHNKQLVKAAEKSLNFTSFSFHSSKRAILKRLKAGFHSSYFADGKLPQGLRINYTNMSWEQFMYSLKNCLSCIKFGSHTYQNNIKIAYFQFSRSSLWSMIRILDSLHCFFFFTYKFDKYTSYKLILTLYKNKN